jgi:regulatory protein
MDDRSVNNPFSRQELDKLTAINPADIRLAAMNLLARREHSTRELFRKLTARFGEPELVEEQIQRLTDERLQSDQRFAESFVRQRALRGKGPLRLRQEMRERGISDPDIERALTEADIDWQAVAADVLVKKFGSVKASDLKEKARRNRFMQYRGFGDEHYRSSL